MNDTNERSVGSTGSVEPVAWAVMDGTKTLVGYHSCSREKAEAWAKEYGFPEVVPLYTQQQPILTDAQDAAIRFALGRLSGTLRGNEECDHYDTLSGLLVRFR